MPLYKEKLKDTLKAEITEQRENHAMMVMAEERLTNDKGFLRPSKSAQIAELEDKLLQLRELQYLVRYGDYMKITPHDSGYMLAKISLRTSNQSQGTTTSCRSPYP